MRNWKDMKIIERCIRQERKTIKENMIVKNSSLSNDIV